MAILPSHPGINITVKCNGVSLQEYDDNDADDQDDRTASKYIEAISGEEFIVQAKITAPWPPYTILLEYYLDRKKVGGNYCRQENYSHPAYIVRKEGASTVVSGQNFLHKFAFSALTVDDTGAPPIRDQLMKDIKGMGEIVVKAWFVKNLQSEATVTDHDNYNKIKELPNITLIRAVFEHRKPWERLSRQRPYRSRDALKSLLIIPRSFSPVPLEERDVQTLNAEELRELVQRQRERDAAARAIKPERGIKREHERERSGTLAADDDEISVISTKWRREQYRTTVDENGIEAIDLT
ncbi:hypothetical protein E8E11_003543 [Didymella keratinophila]|nr:hypothetical protein E8E11_003543 [Didymella keratinophila]